MSFPEITDISVAVGEAGLASAVGLIVAEFTGIDLSVREPVGSGSMALIGEEGAFVDRAAVEGQLCEAVRPDC
jgi:hypothetical protein